MSNLQEALQCAKMSLDHFERHDREAGKQWLAQAIGALEQEARENE
jgi:hypothetical protein